MAELRLVYDELISECLGRDIKENVICLNNLAQFRNAGLAGQLYWQSSFQVKLTTLTPGPIQ